MERATCPGRTGRFGRKGISINFVHDKKTWAQMEEIEKATGKGITRIETTDLDVMEEVLSFLNSCLASTAHSNISCLANEESYEVAGFSELYSIIVVVWRTV
jgi:superfamily II DNA/RNA helicase